MGTMIATICKKTGNATVFLECEYCMEKDACQAYRAFSKKTANDAKNPPENVTSSLEEIVKKAMEEHKKMGDREKRCDFCKFCKRIKTIRESCCDVELYECQNSDSKKYRKQMDEFHIWRSSCQNFEPEEWEE